MEGKEFKDQQARLQKVEQLLRVSTAGWVVGLLAIVLFGTGLTRVHSQPSIMEAHTIQITDSAGRLRGQLGMSSAGIPGFSLIDAAGQQRLTMVVDADGPQFLLYDNKGKNRFAVFADSANGTFVDVNDSAGRFRIAIGVTSNGTSKIRVSKPDGSTWVAP